MGGHAQKPVLPSARIQDRPVSRMNVYYYTVFLRSKLELIVYFHKWPSTLDWTLNVLILERGWREDWFISQWWAWIGL